MRGICVSEAVNLSIKDKVAIVGSGGKTSLCYQLCKENLRRKTLLSTTTKMLAVNMEDVGASEHYFYDFYGKTLPNSLQNGVSVFGKIFDKNIGKISSLSNDEFEILANLSDIFIYEADGSKQKPLKAWSKSEPVFLDKTTKVIGVLPLHVLGEILSPNLVHRFELFLQKFDVKDGEIITKELFSKIAKAMFESAPKEAQKFLFLNRVNSDEDYNHSLDIAKRLPWLGVFAGCALRGRFIKVSA